MSFVIGQVLKASATPDVALSGLVDPNEIGAAGHSNGAITTLGLVANSCCRDSRVMAAVVMAGTTEGLGSGSYNLADGRRSSSSRTSTMASFPMPMQSRSSIKLGGLRRCSPLTGTAPQTAVVRPLIWLRQGWSVRLRVR